MKREQVQKAKARLDRKSDDQPLEVKNTSALASNLDDILDEIDSVLESNAEEFVQNYIQKGGE